MIGFYCLMMCLLMISCRDSEARDKAARQRVEPSLTHELSEKKLCIGSPVFLRVIKENSLMELWMKSENKEQFTLVKTYPIKKWSGELGPKLSEGDGQTPEGFYATSKKDLNPKSRFHLSFNIGYPNAYDRAQGYTGSFIMVHGSNVSIGCLAMGDPAIEEIYTLVHAALHAGQSEVPIQIYPFIPTQDRMLREKESPHYAFWSKLKEAWDYTEKHQQPAPSAP